MSFVDVINRLINEKNISKNALANAIGVSSEAVYAWLKADKPSSPSLDNSILLADYFNISLDELAGRVPPQHTEQEVQLLNMFKKLPDTQKQEVLNYVDFILSK